MPASDEPELMKRTAMWTVGGGAAGAIAGSAQAMLLAPPVVKGVPAPSTLSYVGKTGGRVGGTLAAISGIFAATETVLIQSRGQSVMNSAAAGCASGAALGFMWGGPHLAFYYCAIFGGVQAFGGVGAAHAGLDGH